MVGSGHSWACHARLLLRTPPLLASKRAPPPYNNAPQMSGTVQVGRDGRVDLQEEDGMDYAPVTVKLRGGTEVRRPRVSCQGCGGGRGEGGEKLRGGPAGHTGLRPTVAPSNLPLRSSLPFPPSST